MSMPKRAIKVLVFVSPGILHDMLVGLVGSQPDMEVVDLPGDHRTLIGTVCHAGPDVAIVAPDGALGLNDYDAVLYAVPHLKILAIFGSEQHGLLFELRPYQTLLGEMSRDSLLDAIRITAPSAPQFSAAAQGRG